MLTPRNRRRHERVRARRYGVVSGHRARGQTESAGRVQSTKTRRGKRYAKTALGDRRRWPRPVRRELSLSAKVQAARRPTRTMNAVVAWSIPYSWRPGTCSPTASSTAITAPNYSPRRIPAKTRHARSCSSKPSATSQLKPSPTPPNNKRNPPPRHSTPCGAQCL